MTHIHLDYAPLPNCTNPDTYGCVCVKCNACGRFGHNFQPVKGVKYRCCAICGMVERRDGKNRPCKGPAKLRPMEKGL